MLENVSEFLKRLNDDMDFFCDGMKDLAAEVRDMKEDFVNDMKLMVRDTDKELRSEMEQNTAGVPLLGDAVTAMNKAHTDTKIRLNALKNPFNPLDGKYVEDYADLKPGDHIFIVHPVITHHGVYIGDGRVIHYAKKNGIPCIHEVSLEEFAEGRQVFRLDKEKSILRYSRGEVVRRAKSRLGERDYNLIENNCEQFVRWCRCGDSY